eukprot:5738177-Alexandrium_andersonii.AAC.1
MRVVHVAVRMLRGPTSAGCGAALPLQVDQQPLEEVAAAYVGQRLARLRFLGSSLVLVRQGVGHFRHGAMVCQHSYLVCCPRPTPPDFAASAAGQGFDVA